MNADEMSWLLRRIEDPKTAKRFVQAHCERGRISYQMTVDLASGARLDRLPYSSSIDAAPYFDRVRTA